MRWKRWLEVGLLVGVIGWSSSQAGAQAPGVVNPPTASPVSGPYLDLVHPGGNLPSNPYGLVQPRQPWQTGRPMPRPNLVGPHALPPSLPSPASGNETGIGYMTHLPFFQPVNYRPAVLPKPQPGKNR